MDISDIQTPALLLDKSKLRDNINRMVNKANENTTSLRPHIKTHKCLEVANLQKEAGIGGITVSTLREAKVFASNGFHDITYAVPLHLSRISEISELSQTISLNILVDNVNVVRSLESLASELNQDFNVMVKVDMGYHRCGVNPHSKESVRLVNAIFRADNLRFQGILTHAGNSYSCSTSSCIKELAKQEQEIMVDFASKLSKVSNELYPDTISIGSTPTISLSDKILDEITEIRPGNYVYYDYTQVRLGSCELNDCALTVLTSIIGSYSDRIVIDAGATSLSKDQGPTHIEPNCGYGKIFQDYEKCILDSNMVIKEISQEHGKVVMHSGTSPTSRTIGGRLRILPNHSCLTNNMFKKVHVVEGEKVVDIWEIHSGHS